MSERGRLEVDVTGNASGFRQVLNGAKQNVKQFAGEVQSEMSKSWAGSFKNFVGGFAGMFTFEAIKNSFDHFINRAASLRELSQQMEMGAEATQKWERAASKLGLSFGGMQSVLTAIQQKRIDAATDKNAAKVFERLGISRADVLNLGGVDASAFAQMVLLAGGRSEESRAALGDIVGRRGLKYAGTAKLFPEMEAAFDQSALDAAHEAEEAKAKLGMVSDKFWGRLVSSISNGLGVITGKMGIGEFLRRGVLLPLPTGQVIDVWRRGSPGQHGRTPQQGGYVSDETKGTPPGAFGDMPFDPLQESELEAQAKKDEESRAKYRELDDRLGEAERRNMPAGLRHQFDQGRLERINERIKAYEEVWPALGDEDRAKATQLKIQREGIVSDMREKPLHANPDALAKSGLFTASGISWLEDSPLQSAQLEVLRSIDRKLGGRDPWAM